MEAETTVKEEVRRSLDQLPDNCTWDDVMYKIYVRQAVERGLHDADAGKLTDVEEVRRRVGLDVQGA